MLIKDITTKIMIDKNVVDPTKNFKEIHNSMGNINNQIDVTQKTIGTILKEERKQIWVELDKKLSDIKEMIRKEAEKKKEPARFAPGRDGRPVSHRPVVSKQGVGNHLAVVIIGSVEFDA